MWIGDVVAERFVIERPIGSGGMGIVFYAVDRVEQRPVALKVMDEVAGVARDRFRREALLLAELSHPSIVPYVAHGETPDRELYLVMEWLQGEDLSKRLERGPLSVEETVIVARRAADGLAQAHARGVVHRDVKPSNIFLVQGSPHQAVLLDFGVARVADSRRWTRTGTVVGTVGYMAPEQARAEGETDARVDVFALGCVMFECLTGTPAFGGPHELAVLAKLLAGETPRLARQRPDLAGDLDELLSKMLDRDPSGRPKDAAAVRDALDAAEWPRSQPSTMSEKRPPEGAAAKSPLERIGSERRVRTILFAELGPENEKGSTLTPQEVGEERAMFEGIARKFGAEVTLLPGARLLFGFSGARSARDLAVLAVACAEELRARVPEAKIAIATGTADTGSNVAIGPVIDRVAMLVAAVPTGRIALDSVTAGLLPGRFVLGDHEGLHTLERVVAFDDEPRPLMGRLTPCVGRERELAALGALLDTCVKESVSGVAIVVGEAGVGKTRLRQEFVLRARERHAGLTVLASRGDWMTASSPFAVVRQLVRSAFGLSEGAPDADASTRIQQGIARVFDRAPSGEVHRIADFIGELVGVAPSEPPSLALQSARSDPSLMAQWLHRSFVEWLGALAKSGAVLVVVDDLHWADTTSVAWLDDVLRTHLEVALGVLGLGRRELRERIKPFVSQQEIALDGLRKRASEELVRAVLPGIQASDVTRLIEQSGGNAFYLEELVRHLASGATELPPTVVAMAQCRLEELDSGARSVLRAASVFGERFWRKGVEAILGDRGGDTRRWLDLLTGDELVAAISASRLAGTEEFVFRHALVREAAYATFTDEHRRLAHVLAARWLESAGETDAVAMIGHYERGGAPEEALGWYVAAANACRLARTWDAMDDLTRRGLLVATGVDRGALLAASAYSMVGRARWMDARELCLETLHVLTPNHPSWAVSVTVLSAACTFLGDGATPLPFLEQLVRLEPDPKPYADVAECLHRAHWFAASTGRKQLGTDVLAMLKRITATARETPVVEGWLRLALALEACFETRYFPSGASNAALARKIGGTAGHQFMFDAARTISIFNALFVGDRDLAHVELAKGFSHPGLAVLAEVCRLIDAVALGQLEQAQLAAKNCLGGSSGTSEIQGRALLALVYTDAGLADDAEQLLDAMPANAAGLVGYRADVHMARARIALRRGLGEASLIACDEADAAARKWGCFVSIRQLIALSRVEALRVLGNIEDAKRVLSELQEEISELAAQMDEVTRASYLERGFPSAKILSYR